MMVRLLKFLGTAIAAVALVPLVSLAAFDLAVFQPQASKIHALVEQSAPSEQAPPESLVQVIRAAKVNVSAHAAQLSMQELQANSLGGGMLGWHLASAAWQACVAIHLSEQEQLALFLSLSPMGEQARGFSASSVAIVAVPLASVSIEQTAVLLTVAKAPSVFLASPERLAKQSASCLNESAVSSNPSVKGTSRKRAAPYVER